jgi:hypothetical protein
MIVVLKGAPVCQQRLAKGTSIYIDGLGTNISHLKRPHFAAQTDDGQNCQLAERK